MNIWFDLSNSPHVNLFLKMIHELEDEGHHVIITCRPLANTVELLELHCLKYNVVGEHYGRRLLAKILGYPIRVFQLYRFLKSRKIDVAISQSSFHSPLVASMLGVRSIYMNDNEHALGNIPSFFFAARVMVPEFLSPEGLSKHFVNMNKVDFYPGVKEGIYLWDMESRFSSFPEQRLMRSRPKVYVRPEPWTAQYYKGEVNFLDDLLLNIKDEFEVVILPRGATQGLHYRKQKFCGIRVLEEVLDIATIVPDCDLFIGAGGTMTREMAVLGVPTISVYQDELLDVDKYLLSTGSFVHAPRLSASELRTYVLAATRGVADRKLLTKGRKAYSMIKHAILSA